jgi:hypothetical protein
MMDNFNGLLLAGRLREKIQEVQWKDDSLKRKLTLL